MTVRALTTSHTVFAASGGAADEAAVAGIAYYHTDHELTFYLRAFQHVGNDKLVVVLGLGDGRGVDPANRPTSVRLIQTAAQNDIDPNEVIGGFVPDPVRAVQMAWAGLQPDERLLLLFPNDWCGPPLDGLLDAARRGYAGPPSGADDFFVVDQPDSLPRPLGTK